MSMTRSSGPSWSRRAGWMHVRLGSERAFLYRVARHTAAHAQRTRGRCREIPSGDLPDAPNGSRSVRVAGEPRPAQADVDARWRASSTGCASPCARCSFFTISKDAPERDRGALETSGGHRGFAPSAGPEAGQDAARTRIRAGTRGWEPWRLAAPARSAGVRLFLRCALARSVAIWERCSTAATPSRSICSAPSPHRPPTDCRSAD